MYASCTRRVSFIRIKPLTFSIPQFDYLRGCRLEHLYRFNHDTAMLFSREMLQFRRLPARHPALHINTLANIKTPGHSHLLKCVRHRERAHVSIKSESKNGNQGGWRHHREKNTDGVRLVPPILAMAMQRDGGAPKSGSHRASQTKRCAALSYL